MSCSMFRSANGRLPRGAVLTFAEYCVGWWYRDENSVKMQSRKGQAMGKDLGKCLIERGGQKPIQ